MTEEFLYHDPGIENFGYNDYYDQMLTLTAISSYNREEGYGGIRGKQAMLGREDIDINTHCIAYESAVIGWKKFFEGKMCFGEFSKRVHGIFMREYSESTLNRVNPGKLRKGTIFISGGSSDVKDALFINPAPQYLEQGLAFIGDYVLNEIQKGTKIQEIAGNIHYMIAVLHPFGDGNGRLARIISVTLLEFFGVKDARGFTFVSEFLRSSDESMSLYDSVLNTEESIELTKKIKNGGIEKEYSSDGYSWYLGNSEISFEDYMSYLSTEKPKKYFRIIIEKLEKHNELLSLIIQVFLKAKSLRGDHVLIWKFISKLFDGFGEILNGENEVTIKVDGDMIFSVLEQIDGKLRKNSVRNLLILINMFRGELEKNKIKIEISSSFFDAASKKGILGEDIITQDIRKRIRETL